MSTFAFAKCKRGVAQPGSAPGLGPGGRRFESCRPDKLVVCFPFGRHFLFVFVVYEYDILVRSFEQIFTAEEYFTTFGLCRYDSSDKGIVFLFYY